MSQDGTGKNNSDNGQGAEMGGLLGQWHRERPDIDPSVMAVCGEVWRAGERLRQAVNANLAREKLDLPGFDVLLTLRRQGKGKTLTPSELSKDMMLSTSAMTNRIDRLEKRGLAERRSDPNDRRSLKIALTDAGFALADEMLTSHVETEERLLSELSAAEREMLKSLLARIS